MSTRSHPQSLIGGSVSPLTRMCTGQRPANRRDVAVATQRNDCVSNHPTTNPHAGRRLAHGGASSHTATGRGQRGEASERAGGSTPRPGPLRSKPVGSGDLAALSPRGHSRTLAQRSGFTRTDKGDRVQMIVRGINAAVDLLEA
jgi:hypothetical protein